MVTSTDSLAFNCTFILKLPPRLHVYHYWFWWNVLVYPRQAWPSYLLDPIRCWTSHIYGKRWLSSDPLALTQDCLFSVCLSSFSLLCTWILRGIKACICESPTLKEMTWSHQDAVLLNPLLQGFTKSDGFIETVLASASIRACVRDPCTTREIQYLAFLFILYIHFFSSLSFTFSFLSIFFFSISSFEK